MNENEVMIEINQRTVDCATKHIKALLYQTVMKEKADFAEACNDCEYAENCKFDWMATLKPITVQSSEKISLCHGHIRETRNSARINL